MRAPRLATHAATALSFAALGIGLGRMTASGSARPTAEPAARRAHRRIEGGEGRPLRLREAPGAGGVPGASSPIAGAVPGAERDTPSTDPASAPSATCPQLQQAARACEQRLRVVQAEAATREQIRVEAEGTPIPLAAGPTARRFERDVLAAAMRGAFAQSRVPGRVDGVDCDEYPCIVFGRIHGTEDEIERVERARSLAAYDADIMTVLLWTVTDDAARERPDAPERPEQMLFAVALYPRSAPAQLGENLDHRIRSRTADLWNAMHPADETGR